MLSLKGHNSLSGVPVKNAEPQDIRRGRDGHVESSGHEEADDIFESEFTMLKDIWKFDSVPFPVTKQVRTRKRFACGLCIAAAHVLGTRPCRSPCCEAINTAERVLH